jgi:hypothetical protein
MSWWNIIAYNHCLSFIIIIIMMMILIERKNVSNNIIVLEGEYQNLDALLFYCQGKSESSVSAHVVYIFSAPKNDHALNEAICFSTICSVELQC